MKKLKKGNLVVLKYAPPFSHAQVISIKEAEKEGVKVNLEQKVWEYGDLIDTPIPIGESLTLYGPGSNKATKGFIAVYDRTNFQHLTLLASAQGEFRKLHPYLFKN